MDALIGFAPDADPVTPGVITNCTNFIPYEQGMRGAPTGLIPASTPALTSPCIGGVVVTKLDDTRRIIAGTATSLYELSTGSWTDQTRAAGVYTGGTDTRWSFAQFGNSTLAANLTDKIQRSNTSGVFSDIATAPQAKIIFPVGGFVMALNTVDGTYGTTPNRWWCCALYDETTWTPSVTTLATTGQLVSSPGSITAGMKLGEYAVAYKAKAIHVGQFVGAPAVFDWVQVPGGDAGCVGQDAVCDIGGAHFFVGQDNIWIFDGSRPTPIGVGQLRQWFYQNSNPTFLYKTQCIFDRQNNVVWTFYPSTSSTVCDQAIVYHLQTKKWGCVTTTVEAVLNYISAGSTIDGLSAISSTIDGLVNYSFDSAFWLAGSRSLSVFDTSHQLNLVSGMCINSSFDTGDAGDDEATSLLTKVRIRFAPGYKPSTGSVTTYTKMTEGDSLTVAASGSLNDGKFDVLQSARFHRASFSFTGDVRVLGVGAVLIPQGNA